MIFAGFTFDPIDRRLWRPDGMLGLDLAMGGTRLSLLDADGLPLPKTLPIVRAQWLLESLPNEPATVVAWEWMALAARDPYLTCKPAILYFPPA